MEDWDETMQTECARSFARVEVAKSLNP
jgi:hypothetical protein